MKSLEERLEKRSIKPTSVRLLIFQTMSEFKKAFSLTDLETELETVNKSTIFRTLTLFHDNLLIHTIDDGSGSMKYSICSIFRNLQGLQGLRTDLNISSENGPTFRYFLCKTSHYVGHCLPLFE